MTRVVDRAFEVASATFGREPRDYQLARPFGLADHDPYRWRVSQDVVGWVGRSRRFGDPKNAPPDARLLGEPIEIDEALPPNSMLLEPIE